VGDLKSGEPASIAVGTPRVRVGGFPPATALGMPIVEVGPVSENERERYLNFRAPDGELYELVERKDASGGSSA
jgi:hypothetical protein